MSNHKKVFEVVNNDKNGATSLDVGGTTVEYNKQGIAYVEDAALARDIEALHGRKGDDRAVVIETDDQRVDPGGVHNYSFGMSSMPKGWKDRIDWGRDKDEEAEEEEMEDEGGEE